MARFLFLFVLLPLASLAGEDSREIGHIDTKFNLMSPNDKVVIEAFSDPLIDSVVCYISRPVKGGMSGLVGLAEEKSDSSISCRQTGPVTKEQLDMIRKFDEEAGDSPSRRSVFSVDTNIFFKHTSVVRFMDRERNVLVYMSYARELVDGSPKSSLSVVPLIISEPAAPSDDSAQ